MKRIERFLFGFICSMVLMSSTVLAQSTELSPEDELVEDRKLDVEINDEETMKKKPSLFSFFSNSSKTITCHSSLRVYDDYTYVWAYSYTEDGYMDYIRTTCSASFKSGARAGYADQVSNSGQVWANSAIVDVDTSVFPNLKVYSATSTHYFSRAGYKSVNNTLLWNK